jgi:heavy metal sensor kinase
MFLKSNLIRSIRIRFIAWYSLILTVTFLLFSTVLYVYLQKSLNSYLDFILESKADGIAASINTYWETEKMIAVRRRGISRKTLSKINNENFLKITNRWVEERSDDPDLVNIIIQIYKPNGEIIAYSKSASIVNLPKDGLDELKKGREFYGDEKIEISEKTFQDFRFVAIPVKEEKSVAYIVQVASPLTFTYTTLNRVKLILFVMLPLTVIIASVLAGKFLASITLKPLNSMIGTVRQITGANLDTRVTVPENMDEIRELAETFNDMLERINRSFAIQRQFMQDVSHELKTPLTVIRGEMEVALKRERSIHEYRDILESNLDEIKKINRILESLLALARFDSDAESLHKEPADITVLIKEILTDIEILALQKNIEITVISETSDRSVNIDKERMRRVFYNIFDNAIKYSGENGKIEIDIERVNEEVFINISDTGPGISEEDIPYIFDRFYRADKARCSEGFGLGLSIAKSIVKAHGGNIEVKSRTGEGATFIISLPAGQQA